MLDAAQLRLHASPYTLSVVDIQIDGDRVLIPMPVARWAASNDILTLADLQRCVDAQPTELCRALSWGPLMLEALRDAIGHLIAVTPTVR